MPSRGAWIASVACAATLVVVAPIAPARAARTHRAAAPTAIPITHPLLLGRVHVGAHFRAAAAAPTPVPAKSCYTYDTPDGTGDATGGLDAVDYQLSSLCGSAWVATITASRSFSDPQLGDFEIDFDTDNNLSDGCDGIDTAFVAEPVPDGASLIGAQFIFKGCTAEQAGSLDVSRPTPQSISIPFTDFGGDKPVPLFRSVAFLTGSQHAKPGDFDRVPNTGMVTSQRSGSSAFESDGGQTLNHAYTQVVSGDFNGDGYKDILFYEAGGASSIEYGSPSGFKSVPIRIWGTYHLVAGDFNGDGITDLLLYAPGTAPDAVWYGSRSHTFTSQPYTINGDYQVVSADFNGDGFDDLFFYAPGTAADYIWHGSSRRTLDSTLAPPINNPYRIAAGDFNGDGYGDVVLYAPGEAPDYVFEGSASGHFTFAKLTINGDYAMLLAGDFNGDGADDLLLFNPGVGYDELMLGGYAPGAVLTPGPPTVIDEDYATAIVGDFNNDGADDVFFVAPPTFASGFWDGIPHGTQVSFATFGAVTVDPSNSRVFVTSGATGTQIAVLDAGAHVTNTMTGLAGPTGVAFGPSTVFVALAGSHSIAEFDRTTLAPIGSIDTGAARAQPTSLSYQHGKLWFTFWSGGAVGSGGGLGEWDPSTATVSTVATDVTQEPLLASGTGATDTLVVFQGTGAPGTLARYDLSSGTAVLARTQTGGYGSLYAGCSDMTLSPDGSRLLLACGSDVAYELNSTTLQPTGTQYQGQASPSSIAATSMGGGWLVTDASLAYINYANRDFIYVDRIGAFPTMGLYQLPSAIYPRGITLSANGTRMYVVAAPVPGSHTTNIVVNVLRVR